MKTEPDWETWRRWRELVNLTPAELRAFLRRAEGRAAGLSRAAAARQGIESGQTSAAWLLKMLPHGASFTEAVIHWSPVMWGWARRQVSFIARMSGNQGPLYDRQGRRTRKYTSLLLWGHDPERR